MLLLEVQRANCNYHSYPTAAAETHANFVTLLLCDFHMFLLVLLLYPVASLLSFLFPACALVIHNETIY